MRRLMKRAAAAVLMAACLMSLSACSAKQDDAAAKVPQISKEGTPVDENMAISKKIQAAQDLSVSLEQLNVQKAMYEKVGTEDSVNYFNVLIDAKHEFGEVRDVDLDGASVVLLSDGSYTVALPVTFTEGKMQYVVNVNDATGKVVSEFTELVDASEDDKSVGSLLETATVYAVIGIGTVFTVLIFISLLIACFKLIHKWENGLKAKNDAPAPAPVPVKAAPAAPAAGPDLSGDAELVAVITAAIAAYEGTSSNGLVVRSIRRVQGSRRR